MLTRIRNALQRYRSELAQNSEGSVATTFALSLVPLVGLMGAAVDYSAANNARTNLQIALDAALIAGAKDGSANWTTAALNAFNANLNPKFASNVSPTFQITRDRAYTGSVTAAVPSNFLGVLGVSSINIGVTGTATVPPSTGGYYCVMALNRTAQAALQLTGNASITINAPKCVIQVNSGSSRAVEMNGNTVIKAVENCFVGGISAVGNSSISPAPDATCAPIPDPFANYPRPTVGACTYTNYQLSGNQTVTLQPGVYCGGMTFSSHVNVTFAPGLYVIKDGVISETGGTFTGNGVSFFLTGYNTSVQLSGQANWHLVAPTNGPLPGFAIFLDPDGPSGLAGSASSLSGQSELYFEGIVYLPKQEVTVSGNASAFAPSPYTSYIGDTLRFVGNGDLVINNDTSLTALPLPKSLYVQTGGRPILTQ
ncbi:MAG: pilus assembly protein TadG-related protein [Xanthobacteraceae bacterium]